MNANNVQTFGLEARGGGSVRWILAAIACIAFSSACSDDTPVPVEESEVENLQSSSTGIFLAEYGPDEREHGRVHMNAQFIRIEGTEPGEVFDALEIWRPNWDIANDGCTQHRETNSGSKRRENDSIRLTFFDVGEIAFEGPKESLDLEPRPLPVVSGDLSGVVYGLDFAPSKSIELSPGEDYRIEAPGGPSVGDFSVELPAPAPLGLTIEKPREAGERYALEWNPPKENSGHSSEVFLEFTSGSQTLECRVSDDGTFRIPPDILRDLSKSNSIDVRARRLHSETDVLEDFGDSEFLFSVREARTIELD